MSGAISLNVGESNFASFGTVPSCAVCAFWAGPKLKDGPNGFDVLSPSTDESLDVVEVELDLDTRRADEMATLLCGCFELSSWFGMENEIRF